MPFVGDETAPQTAVRDAVLTVLRDAAEPLHWTVIQDTALRAGLLDPFAVRNVRGEVLRALGELRQAGLVTKVGTGVFTAAEVQGR